MKCTTGTLLSAALLTLSAAVCAQGGQFSNAPNKLPPGVTPVGSPIFYDGTSDDLLTAGLGKTGIGGARPAPIDPTNPADLRKLAIYNNYRALVDPTVLGGYSRFYGPNIDLDGNDTLGEGKIAGTEYIAVFDRGSSGRNVTLMVQVPTTFDPSRPCIVTATSSGSRGVYGAIGTAGDWGLKRGCAVAYADKGSGNGVHDLQDNTINRINGVRADATTAGDDTVFTAPVTALQRQQFNSNWPNRYAVKHAHSQLNPEKDWGQNTLSAVEYAFYVLNEQYGTDRKGGGKNRTITPGNTIVIASSVSNGAGAALQAAEQDRAGLIDGVAVAEPNIQVMHPQNPPIRRGSTTYTGGSKPLYDYFTYANLYQPCASLVPGAAFNIVNAVRAQNRCQSLADAGLLSGPPAQWPQEAMDKLIAYGWQPESSPLQASHYALATPGIATTYSNTYGRFSVLDNLCGLSFASTDLATNLVTATKPLLLPTSFGDGNGVPPMLAVTGLSSGITIVNNLDPRGQPLLDSASQSPSTNREDFNFDGARCQRNLWTGNSANAQRVKGGVAQVQQSARLRGKPAIIVHGRADALIPVNFNSRSYIAHNHLREPKANNVRYVEVTNAQHFEAFLPLPGYSTSYVPLHVYFIGAMNAMWDHLTSGAALPPSQVVRTTTRPTAATALAAENIPPISANPVAADRITFDGNTLVIPD
jgi:hydroxybutyrate-dimer hydrolase